MSALAIYHSPRFKRSAELRIDDSTPRVVGTLAAALRLTAKL